MKRAEIQAKAALAGLLLVALIFIVGAIMYGSLAWWAGGLGAMAMSIVAGLSVWGLVLARQQAQLADDAELSFGAGVTPAKPALGGFRMSYGDDVAAPAEASSGGRALEVGFQRVVVSLASVSFLIVAGVIVWLLISKLRGVAPGKPITVSAQPLDNLALLIGVGAPGIFVALYWMTRVTRTTQGYGEAINGIFSMGLPAMAAIAAATIGGYFKVGYIGEAAAAVTVFFLILQAMELLVNALRSYAGIEEFDQDPVDLTALPLVPMVTSNWIVGLRMLLAQSVGLAGVSANADGPGVVARMMPRVLVAAALLLIVVNCFGIVQPGEVAIRERLGQATDEDIDKPLDPGLHFKFPWPIDEYVRIPTQQLQYIPVGAEEQLTTASGTPLEFRFWTFKHAGGKEDDFVTGDSPPQLLGGFVGVWWKVRDPGKFYRNLSHSSFVDTSKTSGDPDAVERRSYEAIVRNMAFESVTRTFAIHTADQILSGGRVEVEQHCRELLQTDLDNLNTGIEIISLTIKDVHPPIGAGRKQTAAGIDYGPADAYELMIEQREEKQRVITAAEIYRDTKDADAKSKRYEMLSEAQRYAVTRITSAAVEADRLGQLVPDFTKDKEAVTRQWLLYRAMEEVLPQATKVVLGNGVTPPDMWQHTAAGNSPVPMMGAGAPGP